ncbi:DUF2793 domain-containing protein [Hyphomonas sp. FCG-A18]|jgi:hypothetical protein|uniref:DUF2793 domain-containing protein n=1 Tax=Hyphomonas sp. FCG-A18 TaxID=3080019 RepID=UPI002B31E717|nr:DUF2793 domain-containing protein [Hyphomonas sp. FCG-A18]
MSGSDFTPRLGLPYLLPNQAQKHVTLNESLKAVDTLLMAAIEGQGATVPPAAPFEGESWLIGAAATDAWQAMDTQLAVWLDGAWHFYTPVAGWQVWDKSIQQVIVFDGGGWQPVSKEPQNLELLGLATTADTNNPLAVRLNQALFTAREGWDGGSGDLRITLNKESESAVGSLVFQSGWSGRAEIGLVGQNNLSFRVSPDGGTWYDAVSIHPIDQTVHFGASPVPTSSAALDLGQANQIWRDLYLQNAPTISSDRRSKTEIEDLQEPLRFLDFLRPVSFQRTPMGKRHFGFVAQEVREALIAVGHDDAALWRLADPDDQDSQQLLSPDELIAVLVAAIQNLSIRLERLEQSHAV